MILVTFSFSETNDAPNRAIENLRIILEQIQTEFTCKRCANKFVSAENLAIHAKQHKKDQKLYQCTECHVTCTTPYNLKVHIKSAHDIDVELSTAKLCEVTVSISTKGK